MYAGLIHFQPLEVVGRDSETQLQVAENTIKDADETLMLSCAHLACVSRIFSVHEEL